MIVVNGATSPLLGLQWIKRMQLDLNCIIHKTNSAQQSIHKIYGTSQRHSTKQHYKNVLNNEHAHRKKVQTRIQLNSNATPKVFKPRPILATYSDVLSCKRHQNQLRPRYSSNSQSFEIDNLPDDLLNIKTKSKTIQSSHSSSLRYPHRNRKPPDRYSPS